MSHKRRLKYTLLSAVFVAIGATSVAAQQIFDNWNTATCDVTDTATLSLSTPARLDRLDIWYKWGPNETSVAYTVSNGTHVIGGGNLVRAECDPYQTSWCVARDEPGADIPAGTYTFRIANAQVCQNSGSAGQGFIRAYGARP